MKKLYYSFICTLTLLLIIKLDASSFRYFMESASIEEVFFKKNAIIYKEEFDNLQLNAINNIKLNVSSRESFMIEVKPGFHDINANYFKGSYVRGREETEPMTRRYFFKPGSAYLLKSQKHNNNWVFYFKEYHLNNLNKETKYLINAIKKILCLGEDAAPSFQSLKSIK